MKWIRKLAANDQKNNASYMFRYKRFELFSKLISKRNIKNGIVLDIGGTNYFWDQWKQFLPVDSKLVLANISKSTLTGYTGLLIDAKNLTSIKSKSVNVLLSNSLIEHLGGFENQLRFAKEVRRIGVYYFIQTPAFLFPLEPHFLVPFFHWLPKVVRIILHQNYNLGWFQKEPNAKHARKIVEEIRILKKRELKKIFNNAEIITERFLLLPKSYIITNMYK